MKGSYSTREAAGKIGISLVTLQRRIANKSVRAPRLQMVGGIKIRLWTDKDIGKARKVLVGIRPGRKKKK